MLRPQFWSARGASHHPAFLGNCLLVTRVSLIYQVDEFLFCFWSSWTKWQHWENPRLYHFLPGDNQGNEEGRWVQDFFVLLQGFGSFPKVFSRARWHNLVRVERWLIWRLVPLWVMGFILLFLLFTIRISIYQVIFTIFFKKKAINGCRIWEHLHSFREVKCLQGCSKTLSMGI